MSPPPPDLPYKPYVPRRQRSLRPDRPLPPPPPDEPEGDAEQGFEDVYRSPPSPPQRVSSLRLQDKELPPPPSTAPLQSPSYQSPRATSSPPNSAPAQTSDAHLHPYHSTLPTALDPPTTLTPLRAHYLKKTLVALQVTHELGLITDPVLGANALGLLGDPFVLDERSRREALQRTSEVERAEGQVGDLPFLRFMFHQFLLPFPFLASAPLTFWSAKVQPFLSSFLTTTGISQQAAQSEEDRQVSESLMSKEELKEAQERKKLWIKVEKQLAMMFGLGIKVQGGEEVVRIGQAELRRLEALQEERKQKWMAKHGGHLPGELQNTDFEVNVIGVRVVVEKGRVRNRSHEEFIIRTSRAGVPDVFVSRRYGDFRRLAEEASTLRLAFPDSLIAFPPAKDKSTSTAPTAAANSYNYGTYNPLRAIYGSGPAAQGSSSSLQDQDPVSPTSAPAGSPLSREKNRLTLRAYLNTLFSLPFIIESPILRSFLLSGPTTLTPPEAVDCQRRLEADAVREEGRRRFKMEAEKRIEALREGLAQFKGDVLSKEGGLKNVFEVVKRVEKVENLPPAEASVLEWGRISLAATIFQLFVASDTASETLASMKRLHGLMPYFVLKGILKISNPMAMIRGVLDLFLARPFGGQSLIQRMFSSSLTEDVRMLEEDIEVVQDKIDDPVLCQKIEQYAKAPFEVQESYRRDAASEGVELLVTILRSPEVPSLSRPQFQRVARAVRAYKEYRSSQAELSDSDDDEGPENEDAWLCEDLNILLKLWLRKREKEGLLALIFEGVTAELLKDIITIFYTPLAQVYKAASIADSLGDLQAFINDMIRTIEQVEELSQEDPGRTVQTFIDLVQRHEQSFYSFVHKVHSKGHGLFDSLMAWLELFLNYARSGLPGEPIDLDFILPASEEERKRVMREVDQVATYHYKLKVAHEEKVRRRFKTADEGSGALGEGIDDEAELLGSIMTSLNIDQTAIGEADDVADEESEEDDEDERELADLDEEQEDRSNTSPLTSARRGSDDSNSTLSPLANPSGRRGSHSSNHGLHKVRSALHRNKKDKDHAQPSPSLSDRSSGRRRGGGSRKKKTRAGETVEVLSAPRTDEIEALRPLFVEMLRPNLRPKPLK
ncbi:PX domain-containing protein [Cryptococcus wingfieldii CBS 7118]|uniref:PX domain-containing protein n=1 Tax=Cryptococcus wingfieldii CBS 7118 TaxID=1295528 RepID=A0A1E3K4F3_9TREE|nr:PX domain-containing protein [Cryptococcus wingfieldii CBS 7118]ODO07387.1 PX domain-containing protein [Cryptococcus wingfieldii CBS 7118]